MAVQHRRLPNLAEARGDIRGGQKRLVLVEPVRAGSPWNCVVFGAPACRPSVTGVAVLITGVAGDDVAVWVRSIVTGWPGGFAMVIEC
jgi:hypothetical protein